MKRNPLEEYLKTNKMRQRELARKLGVSEGFLSRYLSGSRSFSPKMAIRISDLTGIPMREFYQ